MLSGAQQASHLTSVSSLKKKKKGIFYFFFFQKQLMGRQGKRSTWHIDQAKVGETLYNQNHSLKPLYCLKTPLTETHYLTRKQYMKLIDNTF